MANASRAQGRSRRLAAAAVSRRGVHVYGLRVRALVVVSASAAVVLWSLALVTSANAKPAHEHFVFTWKDIGTYKSTTNTTKTTFNGKSECYEHRGETTNYGYELQNDVVFAVKDDTHWSVVRQTPRDIRPAGDNNVSWKSVEYCKGTVEAQQACAGKIEPDQQTSPLDITSSTATAATFMSTGPTHFWFDTLSPLTGFSTGPFDRCKVVHGLPYGWRNIFSTAQLWFVLNYRDVKYLQHVLHEATPVNTSRIFGVAVNGDSVAGETRTYDAPGFVKCSRLVGTTKNFRSCTQSLSHHVSLRIHRLSDVPRP
jgi:hypothetical protein